jgi:hypothetical protein
MVKRGEVRVRLLRENPYDETDDLTSMHYLDNVI